jgi:phosphotransferase system IIA component
MQSVDSVALNGEQLPVAANDDENVYYRKKLVHMNSACLEMAAQPTTWNTLRM